LQHGYSSPEEHKIERNRLPGEMIVVNRIIKGIEKYLIRTIIFSLLVIVIVQGIMTQDSLRLYLSWSERMEGQVVEYPVSHAVKNNSQSKQPDALEATSPETGLVIGIDDFSMLPRAVIIVNGKEKTTFNTQKVTLRLKAGDVVEIDSSAYNFPVNYRIIDCSSNLSFPKKGTVYTANQSIVMIGKIIVK